jgi:hypothetical protein
VLAVSNILVAMTNPIHLNVVFHSTNDFAGSKRSGCSEVAVAFSEVAVAVSQVVVALIQFLDHHLELLLQMFLIATGARGAWWKLINRDAPPDRESAKGLIWFLIFIIAACLGVYWIARLSERPTPIVSSEYVLLSNRLNVVQTEQTNEHRWLNWVKTNTFPSCISGTNIESRRLVEELARQGLILNGMENELNRLATQTNVVNASVKILPPREVTLPVTILAFMFFVLWLLLSWLRFWTRFDVPLWIKKKHKQVHWGFFGFAVAAVAFAIYVFVLLRK